VAAAMTKASSALHTETIAKRSRTGRIFIDYLLHGPWQPIRQEVGPVCQCQPR
jgi:DNA primase